MTTTGPARDLVHLLSLVEHHAVRHLTALVAPEGVTLEQWRVLSLLTDGQGRAMTEVADHALLPPPTATKLIDRMVSDNLVYRRADPADRRRVLIHLTERGQDLRARVGVLVGREQADLLAAIQDTGELAGGLERLGAALDARSHAGISR